jgi:two-component system phosphate regulon sensor histidine kinase PhoR
MFSPKNLSSSQLSLISALVISIPVSLFVFTLKPVGWFFLVVLVILFLFCFSIIKYVLQFFIHRQIKLIYKLISQTKATKKEEFYHKNILPRKEIDEVSLEVEIWAEQHKKAIELLQQNEIFRKEFLQNLSHELKTPIFSIQGYIETLLDGALHNEEVNVKFLESTGHNIQRLVNLVDDLDQISKLESGELILNQQQFVIQDLLKEVFDSLFIKIRENEFVCTIKKGCELPITVYADKEKIRQVLINIVDNSIKYGKKGGLIEASFYKVEGKNVLIEITDDGLGIAEEHRLRIFERFYRTDQARSRKGGGSGLGLAICKHIIEAHGQTIHVRSKVDVGTTFGFSLPESK